MPTNSRFSKTIKENNFKPFSYFSHNREGASPGYYHVTLDSYGIEAEVTATERTGIHRYSFPKDSISKVPRGIWDMLLIGMLQLIPTLRL